MLRGYFLFQVSTRIEISFDIIATPNINYDNDKMNQLESQLILFFSNWFSINISTDFINITLVTIEEQTLSNMTTNINGNKKQFFSHTNKTDTSNESNDNDDNDDDDDDELTIEADVVIIIDDEAIIDGNNNSLSDENIETQFNNIANISSIFFNVSLDGIDIDDPSINVVVIINIDENNGGNDPQDDEDDDDDDDNKNPYKLGWEWILLMIISCVTSVAIIVFGSVWIDIKKRRKKRLNTLQQKVEKHGSLRISSIPTTSAACKGALPSINDLATTTTMTSYASGSSLRGSVIHNEKDRDPELYRERSEELKLEFGASTPSIDHDRNQLCNKNDSNYHYDDDKENELENNGITFVQLHQDFYNQRDTSTSLPPQPPPPPPQPPTQLQLQQQAQVIDVNSLSDQVNFEFDFYVVFLNLLICLYYVC